MQQFRIRKKNNTKRYYSPRASNIESDMSLDTKCFLSGNGSIAPRKAHAKSVEGSLEDNCVGGGGTCRFFDKYKVSRARLKIVIEEHVGK